MKKIIIIISLTFCGLQLYSQNTDSTNIFKPNISEENLNDILSTFIYPSFEFSYLLRKRGIEYNNNSVIFENKQNQSDLQVAWYFGLYSNKLIYSIIYGQKEDAKKYLNLLNQYALRLGVSEILDAQYMAETIKTENPDNTFVNTYTKLMAINTSLQKQNKQYLVIMIMSGEWLENLHRLCKIAQEKPNKYVNNEIEEQVYKLNHLILLLSFYKENSDMEDLLNEFKELKKVYRENTSISDIDKYPSYYPYENSGDMVFTIVTETEEIQNNLSEQNLVNITEAVKTLRNKMLK